MTPAAVLDILLVAVLLIAVIFGAVRGLIRTLLGVVIFIVALLGSAWIANAAAQPLTDWMMPYVQDFMVQEVKQAITAPQQAAFGDGSLLEGIGALAQEMLDGIVDAGVTAMEGAISGVIHAAVYAIVLLLSFVLLQWVLRLITRPLRLVERIPVFGLLNRLGGTALGLVMGVLICFLVAGIVELTGFIDPNDTFLYGFFAANTPAGLLALFR